MIGPAPISDWRKLVSATTQVVTRPRPGHVFYTSFNGQYSDNPRALYEALAVRADLDHVWHAEGRAAFPPEVKRAQLASRDYPRHLARASHVIANFSVPQYVHRPGATYVQTWHGTPLKKIGLDNPQRRVGTSGYRRALRDYAQWDVLLSQNPHSTEVFRRAFAYDGEILESGYPRNDVLRSPAAAELRQAARAELGVPAGATAVLYAPTYRDDQVGDPQAHLRLDLDRLIDALGPSVVLLLRLHHWVAGRLPALPGCLDVSGHGDIRELYLAADVLVTDYSSSMFDFAVTGRPIVLHVPDLDHYAGSVRGLYFDVVEQAPGPVTRTTDELIAALGAMPTDTTPAYAAFVEAYCPWDDGGAARRVLNRLF